MIVVTHSTNIEDHPFHQSFERVCFINIYNFSHLINLIGLKTPKKIQLKSLFHIGEHGQKGFKGEMGNRGDRGNYGLQGQQGERGLKGNKIAAKKVYKSCI